MEYTTQTCAWHRQPAQNRRVQAFCKTHEMLLWRPCEAPQRGRHCWAQKGAGQHKLHQVSMHRQLSSSSLQPE